MKLVEISIVKIFMNLDTALRKPLGGKKPTSVRTNEIPAAHEQTPSSSSTQSYYKWFCAQRAVGNVRQANDTLLI